MNSVNGQPVAGLEVVRGGFRAEIAIDPVEGPDLTFHERPSQASKV
jgi:hypothetical protein